MIFCRTFFCQLRKWAWYFPLTELKKTLSRSRGGDDPVYSLHVITRRQAGKPRSRDVSHIAGRERHVVASPLSTRSLPLVIDKLPFLCCSALFMSFLIARSRPKNFEIPSLQTNIEGRERIEIQEGIWDNMGHVLLMPHRATLWDVAQEMERD